MSKERVYRWLEDRDYWVDFSEFEHCCEVNGVEINRDALVGITMKDEAGVPQIPKRDLRRCL